MQVSVRCSPSYSIAYLRLGEGERVYVERGAMAAMSGGMDGESSIGNAGAGKALLRRVAGGEDFFMGRYVARAHGAWIAVAPHLPGDIVALEVGARAVICQSGAMLAHDEQVVVDVRWSGVSAVMLREGATMLRLRGDGVALLGSYGAIERIDLGPGETVVVDTGHLVAFHEGVSMRLGALGGAAASVVSGGGLVGHLTGPGAVWIQTRAEAHLRDWLFPERGHNRR
jgi:uncharacterized protein (TIGR00266 family)